jgi:hypothetical protein
MSDMRFAMRRATEQKRLRAYYRRYPLIWLGDQLDHLGKVILARRACRVFGRVFGNEFTTVNNADIVPRPPYLNHVQIKVDGLTASSIVLVMFPTLFQGSLGQFMLGRVRIAAYCTACQHCGITDKTSEYVGRTTGSLLSGLNQVLRVARSHDCSPV